MKSEKMPLTAEEQQKLQRRLRRIAGQLAALEAALKSELESDSFLQQLSAVNGATKGLMREIIALNIHKALGDTLPPSAAETASPASIIALVQRYMKQGGT